ncbi:MAG: hypothetical protein ACM3XO_12135 [Bacteroidota bacterium]
MSNKNPSSNNTPLIIAALIGALGGILAACIGLVPAILPMVRPTSTPRIFDTATASLTDTPLPPDTATITMTSTELPTLTATLEPLPTNTPVTETATVTATSIPPSSDMQAYMGTWTNAQKNPKSDKVRLVITRVEITQTGDATANFSVCRTAEGGDRYVLPNPAPASIYLLGLGARDFVIPRYPDLRWAIIVQRTADRLVATVQEYDLNNILLNTDTFDLEKASLLENLTSCQQPTTNQ